MPNNTDNQKNIETILLRFNKEYIWPHAYSQYTYDNYKWAVHSFVKAVGNKDIDKITMEDIYTWRRFMEAHEYTIGATNSFLYRIRLLLTWSAREFELSIAPRDIIIPKKESRLPKTLNKEQIIKLLKYATPREKVIIMVLFSSGIRRAELSSLRVSDINGQVIKVRGKGNKERLGFIDRETREIIDEYLDTRENNSRFLIDSEKGESLQPGTIGHILSDLSAKSGVHITPHMLRHTFATEMIREGCGAFQLQKILGHEHISTTQIYVHLNAQDVTQAYDNYHKPLLTLA